MQARRLRYLPAQVGLYTGAAHPAKRACPFPANVVQSSCEGAKPLPQRRNAAMLLTIDVGNTNVVFGVFQGDKLQASWRAETDVYRMPDEYAMFLKNLLDLRGLSFGDLTGCIIASVVPPLTGIMQEIAHDYLGQAALIVGTGINSGVRIRTDNPAEVGADRIVNALAAHRLYGGPCVVIDFGTATTFDAVSREGDYLGGAIAPGVATAAEALFLRAAKLPRIELVAPPRVIGTNTTHSMQSGVMFGYVGLVEGLVARFRKEMGPDMKVIATGGLAPVIARETKIIEIVNSDLTLQGLHMIYELNQ
jgi:type III pantothenate kinase